MDMSGFRSLLAFSVCLLTFATAVHAEDGKPSPQKDIAATGDKDDMGARLLFDGKTLKNWKITDFGGQGGVKAEDGKLIMEMGQPLTGVTWDGPELPKVNYEITLEGQRVQGTDFFCCLTFPVKESHCSLVLGGWGGGVTGLSSIDGFDAADNETTDYRAFEKGKWYKVKVRVIDEAIEAWLDDDQIVDVNTANKKIGLRIEVEICKPLGVCTFQTVGAIRNFKLRELSEEEVAKIKQQRSE